MKFMLNILLLILFHSLLVGCVKTVTYTGYTFDDDALATLKEGETRKSVVLKRLGSPSAKSSFGEETWYYIALEQENVAFLKKKLRSQKILAITFDDQVARSIRYYNAKDARQVTLSAEAVVTDGHDLGVLEQLLGNIGRFNSDPSAAKPTRPE